jgi:undecaprenyl diphosphate synthase
MTKKPITSIGVILDGNRRWAKERGLPSLEGHRRGFENVRSLLEWSREEQIKTLYIYAFSTENWNRSPEEVSYLMKLFAEAFSGKFVDEAVHNGLKIVFLGDRTPIAPGLLAEMEKTEERTKEGGVGTLAVCLSYGGRAEILAGVNKLLAEGAAPKSEEEFKQALWGANLPDPDLIIRTGGEKRLSGFLAWQSVYSELFFVDTKWPDFSKEEFLEILEEYHSREQRRGT